MSFDPARHHRRSIRLKGWDYSRASRYFVTLCVKNRMPVLGCVRSEKVELSEIGRIADFTWQWLPERYPYVELDEYRVMPDHLHGIVMIKDTWRDDSRIVPPDGRGAKPLGGLIGAFKTVSTKKINSLRGTPGVRFWQRDFFDRIIRGDADLLRIREYIRNNPSRWFIDKKRK